MNLTFIQDYSSDIRLDSELMGTTDSGLYWNQGVHPLINIGNLLSFIPYENFTVSDYSATKEYLKWDKSFSSNNLVMYEEILYQSLSDINEGNQPDQSPLYWLPTNIESIRLKLFLKSVEANMISALQLSRRIIENQYVYNVGENTITLPEDYAAWVFEPKGSDYVTIRINELGLQATGTDDVPVYVINQGILVDTLTLKSNNGRLVFDRVNYDITGYGRFIFAFDSREVKANATYNDPLKYESFICYPASGIGESAESAVYSMSSASNGMSMNVSTYLDSSKYIQNNLIDFCDMLRMQFEYDVFRLFLTNANNASDGRERNITNDERTMRLIGTEALDIQNFTIASRYKQKISDTKDAINKTLDRFIKVKPTFKVKRRTLG